jgi:Uncharacterised nucleotidyltransferase
MLSSNARAVRTALRDVVLGDDRHATAAAGLLAERELWPMAVALSGKWRMTASLRERLGNLRDVLGAGAPDAASDARMREMSIIVAAQTALVVKRSREALGVLAGAGVDAVAIKGVALIANLYGGGSRRMVGDLDVIVREGAYPAALAALNSIGYVDENPALERHLSDIALSLRVNNVARNVVRDGFEVDVHWQFGVRPLAAFRTDGVIERAATALLDGTPIRVAAPPDAMTISAHHALRGYFVPHEVVKDAFDLAAWWRLQRDAWQLEDVVRRAAAAEVATALYALWEFVRRRNPGHPVAEGLAVLGARLGSRARREAEQLSDFCDEQFSWGSRAERTVQLFDTGRLRSASLGYARRFLVGTPPDGGAQPVLAKRPFFARLAGVVTRIARVLRELVRVGSYGKYRALARALSRHH